MTAPATPHSLTSLIPSHSFQTSTILRNINRAVEFIGTGVATFGAAGSGAGIGKIIIGYVPFMKQQLFSYAILSCAL
jgi:F-type H+-transporting ATPase subunit c